jgi:LysM repeat protein
LTLFPGTAAAEQSRRKAWQRTLLALVAAVSLAAASTSLSHAYVEHEVQAGESLSSIAERYGFPLETLMDVNGITDPDAIHVGQRLRIPEFVGTAPVRITSPGQEHVVAAGETVAIIAAQYGSTISAIVEANDLASPDWIIEGQRLLIPVRTETATAAAAPPPANRTHIVGAGETLSMIADHYGVPMARIVEANELRDPSLIFAGRVLVIPGVPQGPPASGGQPPVHIVQPGETLTLIANRYGVALSVLADANNLADREVIHAGERLLIPGASTPSQTTGYGGRVHTVRAGEALGTIAGSYGVSVAAIAELNGLTNPNHVWVGQVLQIPGGGGPPAPPPPAARRHTVAEGETLAGIAARYGVSVAAIVDLNSLADPNLVVPGQVLEVPAGGAGSGAPGTTVSRGEIEQILVAAADEFGVARSLVKALAWQESGWNQQAVSSAGALGVMQVMPYTAEWALLTLIPSASDWDTNAVSNVRMGTAILHHWLVRADWDAATALAAYFQGWRSLHEVGIYEETKAYVANVLALVAEFE